MGLFSRNEKICSFANAKKLLQTKKYENYVAEPVIGKEGMYKLVPAIQKTNYNNYQSAMGYKKLKFVNLER